MSVIYLHRLSPADSSDLPPDIERAALHASVYMVLQFVRGTAPCIATQTGRLLPYLFTLTLITQSGYFLLPYSTLTDSFPLRNTMLYIARTFLFSLRSDQRQTGLLYLMAKLVFLFEHILF